MIRKFGLNFFLKRTLNSANGKRFENIDGKISFEDVICTNFLERFYLVENYGKLKLRFGLISD